MNFRTLYFILMKTISVKPDSEQEDVLMRMQVTPHEGEGVLVKGDVDCMATEGFLILRGFYQTGDDRVPYTYEYWCTYHSEKVRTETIGIGIPGTENTMTLEHADVFVDHVTDVTIVTNDNFSLRLEKLDDGRYTCEFFKHLIVPGDFYLEEIVYSETPELRDEPDFDPLEEFRHA